MSQASSPSTTSLSLTSITYTPSQSTTPTPTTNPESSSSSHRRAAAIAGSIAALCIVATLLLLSLLFWRRRKRRVLRSQQMAIRRMTIVGPPPPSTLPPLPYPFTGSGNRRNFFSGMSFSGIGDFEMSAAKNASKFGDNEAGLPQTSAPAPTLPKERDRVDREQRRTLGASTVPPDSASVCSLKQSEHGDDNRMVFVNGVYVLALTREDGHSDVEGNARPKRPSN